jgi:hypothetical protein
MTMHPDIEQTLTVEYDELFALSDHLRQVADNVRARLLTAGLQDPLEADLFDRELELRGTGGSHLAIRLDGFRLEITGAPPELQIHLVAAILLDEAGVFRLASVEAGRALTIKVRRGQPLHLVHQAFPPVAAEGDEPMLDRRFSMTWDWGTATTGYSFHASDTEDRELFLSFKAREGYMTLAELQSGHWIASQASRYDALVARFLTQLGWNG